MSWFRRHSRINLIDSKAYLSTTGTRTLRKTQLGSEIPSKESRNIPAKKTVYWYVQAIHEMNIHGKKEVVNVERPFLEPLLFPNSLDQRKDFS
jgi:hypothetical protein